MALRKGAKVRTRAPLSNQEIFATSFCLPANSGRLCGFVSFMNQARIERKSVPLRFYWVNNNDTAGKVPVGKRKEPANQEEQSHQGTENKQRVWFEAQPKDQQKNDSHNGADEPTRNRHEGTGIETD